MKIEWDEPAVDYLQGISIYMALDSPIYARRMVDRIFEGLDLLEKFPERSRRAPEALRSDVKEIWINPFRVIYRATAEKIVVLAVVHGRRNFGNLDEKPWEAD